ncbi:hypothetical protein [Telluribacter humicola]|uniref:hypothetical protein n=1 Tax=Telluribacter humicola TaxID=1720261 RepID=UPI001A96E5AE|nr:hypothetical protein [Telluribacter humicola]
MKYINYLILFLLTASISISCKEKNDPVTPQLDFYGIISGHNPQGREWTLTHFYSRPASLSSYENTVRNGTDGALYWSDWIKDNYYRFGPDGYGVCYEVGVVSPYLDEELSKSWDDSVKAFRYEYIQFTYRGGDSVEIINRVQKPAFFGTWQIIKLEEDEIILYQQDKEFNQEHALVFNPHTGD